MSEWTTAITVDSPPTGFDFGNHLRNQHILRSDGNQHPHHSSTNDTKQTIALAAKKTGTTIVGVQYDGGVVLGADTRATNGTEVAEKNCKKIAYVAPNMYCCGAGTAADTDNTCALISQQLELQRLDTYRPSRLSTAVTLFKRHLFPYQGHISAALVLGGCDLNGPAVYQIYPHGSTARLPYTSMGSGSLAAMAVLESGWKDNLTEAEAITLVQRAIGAGIFNDLGSGSNTDLCIIRMDGTTDYRRGAVKPNEIGPLRAAIHRSGRLTLPQGITPVISTTYKPHPAVPSTSTGQEMEVEG